MSYEPIKNFYYIVYDKPDGETGIIHGSTSVNIMSVLANALMKRKYITSYTMCFTDLDSDTFEKLFKKDIDIAEGLVNQLEADWFFRDYGEL